MIVEECRARELFSGDRVWCDGEWRVVKAGGTQRGATELIFSDGHEWDGPSDELFLRDSDELGVVWHVGDVELSAEADGMYDRLYDCAESAYRSGLPLLAALQAAKDGYSSAEADLSAEGD